MVSERGSRSDIGLKTLDPDPDPLIVLDPESDLLCLKNLDPNPKIRNESRADPIGS